MYGLYASVGGKKGRPLEDDGIDGLQVAGGGGRGEGFASCEAIKMAARCKHGDGDGGCGRRGQPGRGERKAGRQVGDSASHVRVCQPTIAMGCVGGTWGCVAGAG